MLVEVVVGKQESIPALCEAIAQGCCRRAERISLGSGCETLTLEQESLLAAALGLEGALPALTTLRVDYQLTPNGLSNLARALMEGTAPQLRDLSIGRSGLFDEKYDMVSFANMLEARASIPGCAGFESLHVNNCLWFHNASLETQIRCVHQRRVLLQPNPDGNEKHRKRQMKIE